MAPVVPSAPTNSSKKATTTWPAATHIAHQIAAKCVENGLLIITAKDLLRMLPPLVINYDELDEAVNIIEKTLKENR